MELTHFNQSGRARMVDVSVKNDTRREAVAEGRIRMQPATLALIKAGAVGKGDVLGVAQVAGIMAAKQTWQLIPMCHPLLLTGVDIGFAIDEAASAIDIVATVRTTGKTGVEMEALTAVTVAALAIYDMAKAVDKGMVVEYVRLTAKSGGKSGDYVRNDRD
ncbi:cyclic pyranopterin monophosphate synthase MoaC [Anaeroselena agilis]|uniref:Cyclic pyranopterin monophosphate synthase n=1 Tax=Anaeroselena agilis TaxID=3063788 RepID=A0ABU3NUR1_9FIRM|nr:cyclic pyranopterin monophosphate synthase MoaC [Selenomonadales bacterium 4137-cl]